MWRTWRHWSHCTTCYNRLRAKPAHADDLRGGVCENMLSACYTCLQQLSFVATIMFDKVMNEEQITKMYLLHNNTWYIANEKQVSFCSSQRSSGNGLSLNNARARGNESHLATKSCQLVITRFTTHTTNVIYNTYMCMGNYHTWQMMQKWVQR